MGSFTDGFTRYRSKVAVAADQQFRAVCLELFSRVVMRTPVDKGYARGSWVLTSGAEPSWFDTQSQDRSGGATVESFVTGLSATSADGVVWIASGLPYMQKLEHGGYPNPPKSGSGKTSGGYSIQAPAGMVQVTAAEFGSIVDEAKAA
jgi:hypothetical protein